ncbi:MAG: hypothetical protein K6E59_05130 [Bacilli bacterium]|nr:hypothetical protein [Bacilli bacterium]
MEEKKPSIDIKEQELYDLASVLGLMTRAFADWDKEIYPTPHELSVPGIMVGIFLLDRQLGGEVFKAAWNSFLDVSANRKILPGTEKEVVWPEWDMESLEHPELAPLNDLCIMLAAWNFAAKQDEYPPEMFLGPLFSLAGSVAEGVARGYYLKDDKSKALYEQQREKLAGSHGSVDEFKKALESQLTSIDEALQSARKLPQS